MRERERERERERKSGCVEICTGARLSSEGCDLLRVLEYRHVALVDRDALVVLLGEAREVGLGGGESGPEAASNQMDHQQGAGQGEERNQDDRDCTPASRLVRRLSTYTNSGK
jgi:hypothetical protein